MIHLLRCRRLVLAFYLIKSRHINKLIYITFITWVKQDIRPDFWIQKNKLKHRNYFYNFLHTKYITCILNNQCVSKSWMSNKQPKFRKFIHINFTKTKGCMQGFVNSRIFSLLKSVHMLDFNCETIRALLLDLISNCHQTWKNWMLLVENSRTRA